MNKHLAVHFQTLKDDLLSRLSPRTDLSHALFHLLAQKRLAQRRTIREPLHDVIIALDQRDAQLRGDKLLHRAAAAPSVPHGDVLSIFNFGDVFGHGSVGADAVGVHEADEFGLGEVVGRGGFALEDLGLGGLEELTLLEMGELLAAFPFVVNVYVQVVPFQDHQAIGVEEFVAVLDFDFCALAFGVVGTAG